MFGGGYRVGVSVTPVEVAPWPASPVGVVDRPSRLAEVLPPGSRTVAELAADLARITEIEAALAGYRVAVVAELAARRPGALDTPGSSADPATVDEFFSDELAMLLNSSRTAATVLYENARTLTERLPATQAALADGALDWPRARAIATELGRPADGTPPGIVAAVEVAVLPTATSLSIQRLREAVRADLVARDAAAGERRRRQAEQTADVTVRSVGDGMAELVSGQRTQDAAAMRDMVDRLARMRRADGDDRPIGVIRACVLKDLVLRPWDTTRPAVTAHLDIVAPLEALGGTITGPGEAAPTGSVDGMPITATHLKELLGDLDMLGVRTPEGGSIDLAITDPYGRLLATATLNELRRLATCGFPAPPDTPCPCSVLTMPPEIDRYRPPPAQHRFVNTRDRTCRHPGCPNRAEWADHDHVVPHARGGPTSCTNLCCLCRRHHRLKTHARGWAFRMDPDGTLHVTTPSGVTRTTRPPGYDPPPPDPADDPPPF